MNNLPPGYKQTEVGVIPVDWDSKSIDEVGFVTSGKRLPLGSSLTVNETSHPYIRVTDMRPGTVSLSDIKFVPDHIYPAIKRYRIFRDDIFISVAGTLGIVGKIPAELDGANLTENADRITNILCSQGFLLHVLMSPLIQNTIDSLQTVGAQPKLALTRIRKFAIPLPPTRAEQEAIAEALSDADALIESLEQLIAKKRHIKQGAMQELLTGKKRLPGFSGEWEVMRLGDVADPNQKWSFTGGPFGSNLKSSDYTDDGVRIIQLQNIGDGQFHNDYAVFTSPEKADELLSCNIYPGEIILSKMGDPVARACIIPPHHERYLMCSDGIRLAVNPKRFNTYFVYVLINAPDFRTRAENAGTGSTRKRIGLTELRNLELLCPELPEQTAIATILSDMDAEIAALETKLAKTCQLKQGMMHNLLSGRIRLVDPAIAKGKQLVLVRGKNTIAQEPDKPHTWAINEAVVISVLVDQFGKPEFPLGRKRYTKLSYLMHRKAEQEAQGYLKKAAGPYNPKIKYAGPEKIARENGYVREHQNGKFKGFVAADKIEQAKTYFAKWYGTEITAWLEQFRYKSNDELECLATVDMAIQELLKQGKTVDVDSIRALIASEPEWLPKLERTAFSDSGIAAAIAECHAHFAS